MAMIVVLQRTGVPRSGAGPSRQRTRAIRCQDRCQIAPMDETLVLDQAAVAVLDGRHRPLGAGKRSCTR